MHHDLTVTGVLDPYQLATAAGRPLPRRHLGRVTLTLLILLRVYVILAIPIVCYAFVHALLVPPR